MTVLATPLTDASPEPFSVAATVSLQERRYRTLKSDDTFAVFDYGGDFLATPGSTNGLYHRDTRHLSRFDLTLGGARPLLLSSSLADDNVTLTSDLSNASVTDLADTPLDYGQIHLQRSTFLWRGACHERLLLRNFSTARRRLRLQFRFEADFADLFEVRGMRRARRGEMLPATLGSDTVTLAYRGLDGLTRTTRLHFEPEPALLAANRAGFDLELAPHGRTILYLEIACTPEAPAQQTPRAAFLLSMLHAKRTLRANAARAATIASSSEVFDEAARRAAQDLAMLVTDKPTGPYPYAGIPWFSTAFGRDALLTALQTLWLDPALARGVLFYLAQEQATALDPASDAEPGKILHEVRGGEMAELGEIPFRRYYGSVDATPLFVMLAGAYLDRTGDLGAARALWPHVEAALAWMDRRANADGFVAYHRMTEQGLANQGWKDSYDAISHADGSLAEGPIALCEVQGYLYAARQAGASIARRLGHETHAARLEVQAEALRQAFEARFWCERLGTYALALDGEGRPCEVRASNAGHLLITGIATPERAEMVARGLLLPRFFTGWGIRTLAADEARYNPMSYHNGSVWPHDNAVIALGMARYGLRAETARVFEAMHAAALAIDLRRLPELFCGFHRRPGQGPTAYPVACSPQAWSAAALPAFVQACLGLGFDAASQVVRLEWPVLPKFLDRLTLRSLSLGEAKVSVMVRREGDKASVSVLERNGNVQVEAMV